MIDEIKNRHDILWWLELLLAVIIISGTTVAIAKNYFVPNDVFNMYVRANDQSLKDINLKLDPVVDYFKRQAEDDAKELKLRREGRWKN